ncbi:MAG: hypothetical protein RBS81_09230 [Tenuifilaceae bacterium]|jgi:hypothetical protein|nr:hypothetical protein [Tenuifilaceae bacterium]
MKKVLLVISVILVAAFNCSKGAASPNDCETITIICNDGSGTNLITCGSDAEKMADVDIVQDAICD